MNSPATAPAFPAFSAPATCPRDGQARLDYFCTTFCGYCLPHDVDGESFTCAYGEPELSPAPGVPGLPVWEPWYGRE